MIRIVGIQKSERAEQEFVLLQNQGSMRSILRGQTLLADSYIRGESSSVHAFTEEVSIAPGQFVLVRSGSGADGWITSKDGSYVYQTHLNAEDPLWSRQGESLHILSIQHTYCERKAAVLV